MKIEIKLKDERYCNDCPLRHGLFCKFDKFAEDGYYMDLDIERCNKTVFYIRPEKCREENGE